MFYNTIDRKIISNALATGREVRWGDSNPYCGAVSPTFTAKWVPRIPMEAVGVSKRAFSGAILPMRPERYAMVPLEIRTNRLNFPSEGEKRKSWRTSLLDGPSEREELSRRMTPRDPSGPVPRVSPE